MWNEAHDKNQILGGANQNYAFNETNIGSDTIFPKFPWPFPPDISEPSAVILKVFPFCYGFHDFEHLFEKVSIIFKVWPLFMGWPQLLFQINFTQKYQNQE